jgi:hypothetical protein
METFLVDEETGLIGKSNVPPDFNNPEISASEKGQRVINNWRELLRILSIRVTIYPDHSEIGGAIPPQFIRNTDGRSNNVESAPITCSVED